MHQEPSSPIARLIIASVEPPARTAGALPGIYGPSAPPVSKEPRPEPVLIREKSDGFRQGYVTAEISVLLKSHNLFNSEKTEKIEALVSAKRDRPFFTIDDVQNMKAILSHESGFDPRRAQDFVRALFKGTLNPAYRAEINEQARMLLDYARDIDLPQLSRVVGFWATRGAPISRIDLETLIPRAHKFSGQIPPYIAQNYGISREKTEGTEINPYSLTGLSVSTTAMAAEILHKFEPRKEDLKVSPPVSLNALSNLTNSEWSSGIENARKVKESSLEELRAHSTRGQVDLKRAVELSFRILGIRECEIRIIKPPAGEIMPRWVLYY